MSEKTKISWCDSTWNPWRGCAKISPGCENCYAAEWGNRFGVEWGKGKPRHPAKANYLRQPVAWNKKPWLCDGCGYATADPKGSSGSGYYWCPKCDRRSYPVPPFHRRRVFCGSLMDWLDPEIPIMWLAHLLRTLHDTPNIIYLTLSKRPELFGERTGECCDLYNGVGYVSTKVYSWLMDWRMGRNAPANVWIGATCENQEMADKRIPELLRIPATKRFLSVEPMLGPIEFGAVPGGLTSPICQDRRCKIDLVIFGGESGPKARPLNIDWIRDGVRQCKAAGVKAFVKQLGARPIGIADHISHRGDTTNRPDGFYRFLNDRAGADPAEWPEDLRVQEMPV